MEVKYILFLICLFISYKAIESVDDKSRSTAFNQTRNNSNSSETTNNTTTTQKLSDKILQNRHQDNNSETNGIDMNFFTFAAIEETITSTDSSTVSVTTKISKTESTLYKPPPIPTVVKNIQLSAPTKAPIPLNPIQSLIATALNANLGPVSLAVIAKALLRLPVLNEIMEKNKPLDFVNPYPQS